MDIKSWFISGVTLLVCILEPVPGSIMKVPCASSSMRCGYPAIEPSYQRIIGGREAQIGAWPWMVILVEDGFATCGGAIISENLVLSANHCFLGASGDPSKWQVIAGKHHLDRTDPGQKVVKIKKIIMHTQYNNVTLEHDIALVVLEDSLSFSTLIQPICLPSADQGVTTGQVCMLAGWGQTRGTSNQNVLNQVILPVIAHDVCAQNDWYGKDFSPTTTFCAGYENGGKDACTGDSGGPLICKTGRYWFVQGISSWGYGCAEYKWPGVYTDVSKYAGWIQAQVLNHNNCGGTVVG